MLDVRLTIKVKAGIPESFKLGWYPHKITGSSYLKGPQLKPTKSGFPLNNFPRSYDHGFVQLQFSEENKRN